MTANSLSNKMFANLHKQRIDNVNLETVASDFIARSKVILDDLFRATLCSVS